MKEAEGAQWSPAPLEGACPAYLFLQEETLQCVGVLSAKVHKETPEAQGGFALNVELFNLTCKANFSPCGF